MCGIAGILSPAGFDPEKLMRMTHLVTHRGPNGFGFAYASGVANSGIEIIHNENRLPSIRRPVLGLGSRRLSILDRSSHGNMPMQTEDGNYSIVFNGEIYNYKEVREQLRTVGHHFRSGTDTEVILHAYQEWGEECLRYFNGMWSFALLDSVKHKLFCARDRFGVKPFYYATHEGSFYFASEIKQILQASAMPRVANAHIVHDFLEWGLLDHKADTFFEGIYQLQGGHSLSIDLNEPLRIKITRYWELLLSPQEEISGKQATGEFKDKFENAIRLRLRSDVPVGICLSGGLDSSAILCQARTIDSQIQFQAFSACFEDKNLDEREYISAALTASAGLGHTTYPHATGFWKDIDKIAYHHDEPVGGTSVFAQWSVMAEARKQGISVVLGGQGGDETLCGYLKYRYFYLWHLFSQGRARFLSELYSWAKHGTTSYWTISAASRYLPRVFRKSFSLTNRVGTAELKNEKKHYQSFLGAANSIAERQKIDLTQSSLPTLLRHEDRNSMAHSIESRMPFLDYQLAEFAVNCHPSLKLRNGWSKWILRNAMTGILPEAIRLRKTKLGFDTPEADWLQFGLNNGHRSLWDTPKLRMHRFLDGSALKRECQQFLAKDSGALNAGFLFRAISLELWAVVHQVS